MSKENTIFHSIEIIEKHINEKLSAADIASSVYFSKYHYQRLFREIVGDSVMDYVAKRKLTLAGKELLSTDKSVLKIAFDYGYNSHESFTRAFKLYMGISPSEYRKYCLATIVQNTISPNQIKERFNLTYSQNTNEIIRELNDFIAKAKETAEAARKCTILEYLPFWKAVAERTDTFADNVKNSLERIAAIAENPDEITNRFSIIKLIEDVSFETNLLSFNVNLMVSRGNPAHIIEMQKNLCDSYKSLAKVSAIKTTKVATLLNELSGLIFNDMRKSATEKIQALIYNGHKAADEIQEYPYIKDEILNIVNELSSEPCGQVTIKNIEDYAFRLNIISFAADMDVFRSPKDERMFSGLKSLKKDFADAVDFLSSIVISQENSAIERTTTKHFTDIAFQGNILLFYTRGEVEKMGSLLSDEQKTVFIAICCKVDDFIRYALKADEAATYKPIVDILCSINEDMQTLSPTLADKGGAMRFLANEFKSLADSVARVMRCE